MATDFIFVEFKELNENIKVIITSAYDSIGDNKLNFELLRKPFTLKKLLDMVAVSLYNTASPLLSAGLD